ncbi:hypothetical protein B0H10DRAFT_2026692 [Mycena sp. CBHHK59/15]|nr:hypothetical protein B0H10DRAFT_2026692 [Mycena sp. CBHHK59/15]
MPYLFPVERVGRRDEPCQPWEGTRGDWHDLEPELAGRLLPFPDSPLDAKGNQPPPSPQEHIPRRARSASPVPELGLGYIPYLAVSQALQQTSFAVVEGTGTHQMITRFWIRPRNQLPAALHASPDFVRKVWVENPSSRTPSWTTIDTSMESWSIKTLRDAVRITVHCAKKYVNQSVATDLLDWAYKMTPSSSVAQESYSASDEFWPLSTPRRTRKSCRIHKCTRVRAERVHWEAVY